MSPDKKEDIEKNKNQKNHDDHDHDSDCSSFVDEFDEMFIRVDSEK